MAGPLAAETEWDRKTCSIVAVFDVTAGTPVADLARTVRTNGTVCFFCGTPLRAPFIGWFGSGGDGEISLHPACTVELAIRLLRDVHALEHSTGRYVTGERE